MPLLVIELEEQLLKEFRRFAVNKHGRIRGVLKPEVELALRNHLKQEEKAASEDVTSGPKVHNPGGLKVHTSTSLASNL